MRYFNLVAVVAFILCSASVVQAGEVIVNSPGSYESRTLELEPGARADLTVYLKSDGEMLDGFRVILVRDADRKLLAMLQSDIHGIVTFENLPEGKYTVMVKKTRRERRLSSLEIGDWRIVPHGQGKQPKEVTELQSEVEGK